MFHACVRKFDVTDIAQTFLGKHSLRQTRRELVSQTAGAVFSSHKNPHKNITSPLHRNIKCSE